MARQRRGGGFRPPELRGTLGTLLRTTLAQAGTLRDVLERGAREGRSRLSRLDSALSDARSSRRRHDALAELGDIVLDLIRRGEIDLDELPEARDLVTYLDALDADADADADAAATAAGAADPDHDADHDEPRPASPARNRFDARGRPSGSSRTSRESSRTSARNSPRDSDEDGTVSSQSWSRPRPSKPQPRVWRPPVDADTESPPPPKRSDDEITARDLPRPSGGESTAPGRHSQRKASGASTSSTSTRSTNSADDRPTEPGRPSKRKDPARKGGIHFDDDEDLAEYMHPDDVPPKGTPDGDS